MNIKDNIQEVKKELSADEQMLASAFKIEKFYKKHKIKIISLLVASLLTFSGVKISQYIEQSRLESANQAYLALLKNSGDTQALEILKEKNPILFELYSYKNGVLKRDLDTLQKLSSNKNLTISDISNYHFSVMKKMSVNSRLYNEMAVINNATLLIKAGKPIEAQSELAKIDEKSPVYNIATIIKHYTIKGK